jgi:hypothetical protein
MPQRRHFRRGISFQDVTGPVAERFRAELGDGRFEQVDSPLQRVDRAGVQADFEVFLVNPVVNRCDVAGGHGGEVSFPAFRERDSRLVAPLFLMRRKVAKKRGVIIDASTALKLFDHKSE